MPKRSAFTTLTASALTPKGTNRLATHSGFGTARTGNIECPRGLDRSFSHCRRLLPHRPQAYNRKIHPPPQALPETIFIFDVRGEDISKLSDSDLRSVANQLLPANNGTFWTSDKSQQ